MQTGAQGFLSRRDVWNLAAERQYKTAQVPTLGQVVGGRRPESGTRCWTH
jgi:hypothetical protein